MRYRCNGRLRNALYHWTRSSVQNDSHSKEQYARLKQAGHGYSRALRGVADRLLTVLVAMLRRGEPYDSARRAGVVAALGGGPQSLTSFSFRPAILRLLVQG